MIALNMFTRPNKGCPRGTWAGRWLLLLKE
jgi:hypothetical protein